MRPPTRNQKNFLDHPVEPTIVPLGPKHIEDLTVQSQAAEADINMLLARYGVGPIRPLQYGEVDDNLSLQDALDTIAQARRIWHNMPEAIRKDFRSYSELITAIQRGEVRLNEGEPPGPLTEEQELAAIEAAERRDNLREAARQRKLRELGVLPPKPPTQD